MADYDVQPVGLTKPPQASYLETYRPAVATRNNGLYPADVTGYLRIYDAATGLLIFTTDLAVLNIEPGETRDALGATHWTPEEIGDYRVIATVTTPKDQVPGNDNLSPVTIHVSEEPPPPPPPVTPHAPQHEHGGADQLSVDGLHGTLADGQPLQAHAATHMVDGADEMSVGGMAGELADPQTPKEHGNEAHEIPFVTAIALEEHDTSQTAHDASENIEKVAHKGQPSGYAELDGEGRVPPDQLGAEPDPAMFLRGDQTWQDPVLTHGADKHDGTVEATENKGQADGYPELDAHTRVPVAQVNHAIPQLYLAEGAGSPVEVPAGEEVTLHATIPVDFPELGQRVIAQVLAQIKYEEPVTAPGGHLRITIADNIGSNSAEAGLAQPGLVMSGVSSENPYLFPFSCLCSYEAHPTEDGANVHIAIANYANVPMSAWVVSLMVYTHNKVPE